MSASKNIEEYVINKILEYATKEENKYNKLRKKYDALKKEVNQCYMCKRVIDTQKHASTGLRMPCGDVLCSRCYHMELSLMSNYFRDRNLGLCVKCLISKGFTTYNDIRNNVSDDIWLLYRQYASCLEKKYNIY